MRASGASDNNGGAFKAGAAGTDRSQQNAAQVAIDNSLITTSITANVITFTGYAPTSADVGNVVQMLTGTNVTAGFYEITAQTSTTWTVTGAVNLPTSGTTTNATGNMGGALATLAKVAAAYVASNKIFAKGAFTSAASNTFAQGATPSGTVPRTRVIGYGATRGDGGHATLTLQTNTGLFGLRATAAGINFENFDVDCASLGTSIGISMDASFGQIRNCKVSNHTLAGINLAASSCQAGDCEATGGTSASLGGLYMQAVVGRAIRCNVHDNACPGIRMVAACETRFCLVANNTGANSDGIVAAAETIISNNTVHGNGRDGIRNTGAAEENLSWINNILTNNGGFGLNAATTAFPAQPEWDGNAYFGNTSGARTNADSTSGIFGVAPYTNVFDKILSSSPYVGPTSGATANFGLNNTAGGGADCRAAGRPGAFPGLATTVGYQDMGAVQHQDVTSGGLIGAGSLQGGMQ